MLSGSAALDRHRGKPRRAEVLKRRAQDNGASITHAVAGGRIREPWRRTDLVTIGALSERTEVNIETIRYYERIGILPKPPRSAGGHRLYAEEYQRRLVFVRRARELGFSLRTCARFFALSGDRHMACGQAKRITEKHVADIHRKVDELKRLERALSAMVTQCRGDDTSDCPIT